MIIERFDFHVTLLEEGKDFYQCLRKIDKDKFNVWVQQWFIGFGKVYSFEDVKPDPSLIALSELAGYKHIDAQCHYSAKAISILMPEFEYWTGFISRNASLNPIVTHSFNVYQGQIVDFSKYISDPFYKLDLKSYPHEYFGVDIPREFVLKFKEETLNEFSMDPLICEWFHYSVGKINCD